MNTQIDAYTAQDIENRILSEVSTDVRDAFCAITKMITE